MAGAKIALSSTTGELRDDGNNNARVNLPLTKAQAGFAALLAQVDDGSVTGAVATRPPIVTMDNRLRVGVDSLIFSDSFTAAAINTAIWQTVVNTGTITFTAGYVNINGGASVAINANERLISQPFFPMLGEGSTMMQMIAQFTAVPQTNCDVIWGFVIPSTGASTAHADGVYFQLNSAAELRCVVNYNGTLTQSAALNFSSLIGTATERDFTIIVGQDLAEFFINGVRVAAIARPAGQASMTISSSLPVAAKIYNIAALSTAQVMKIGFVAVGLLDIAAGLPFDHGKVLSGGSAYQGQNGMTMGSTANYANSANPTAAVPTNTTAALGTGLGGQFWETDTLAVTTDGILCSFQVPVGSATVPGKTLMVTAVNIYSYIQTALTGGGYNEQLTLAFGHTAVSLATADSATAKAPRRVPLGARTVASGATALTQLATITKQFKTPIAVFQGEFIAVVKKKVGTAPSAGTVAHVIDIEGYYI